MLISPLNKNMLSIKQQPLLESTKDPYSNDLENMRGFLNDNKHSLPLFADKYFLPIVAKLIVLHVFAYVKNRW